jgi:hypothetical protein
MRGIEPALRMFELRGCLDIVDVICLAVGFAATDTAKVNAERANLTLRILPR